MFCVSLYSDLHSFSSDLRSLSFLYCVMKSLTCASCDVKAVIHSIVSVCDLDRLDRLSAIILMSCMFLVRKKKQISCDCVAMFNASTRRATFGERLPSS